MQNIEDFKKKELEIEALNEKNGVKKMPNETNVETREMGMCEMPNGKFRAFFMLKERIQNRPIIIACDRNTPEEALEALYKALEDKKTILLEAAAQNLKPVATPPPTTPL